MCTAAPPPFNTTQQEAGYDEATQQLINDVMMGKAIPDPRDIRKYDLIGALGMVNFRILKV
jgi:hypothetical protein